MDHKIEFNETCFTIINNVVIAKKWILDIIKSKIDEKRYAHSLSVANLCYQIAISNNIANPLKYYFAGLVHDIAKGIEKDELKKMVEEHCPEYLDMPSYSFHAFLAPFLVKTYFDIDDKEINESLTFHCTGNKDMSLMSKVVYASDKIDPLRGYDSTDMINSCKKDITSGFLYVLKENLAFIDGKKFTSKYGNNFNKLTEECRIFYMNTSKLDDLVIKTVENKKGELLKIYDVKGKSSLCDTIYVVLALNNKNMISISEDLKKSLIEYGLIINSVIGQNSFGWVVVDASDIIIHIFIKEELERLNFIELLDSRYSI